MVAKNEIKTIADATAAGVWAGDVKRRQLLGRLCDEEE
jgi:hypothetical protein